MKPIITVQELYDIFTASTGISTDTRSLQEGNLFIALKGDNFNGNLYAAQALEKGASYAVVDDEAYAQHDRALLAIDGLIMLQALAKHHRQQFDIPVIAMTGSNGKTTTKELCHHILSKEKEAYATAGNFNNHIGVPLTLLRMPKSTEIAIIEMGDNKLGDITELCHIALPTHGVITNIGKDHLEGFGGFDGNIRAKSEIFQYLLETDGTPFVNSDDPLLCPMGHRFKDPVWYGSPQDDYYLVLLKEAPFIQYKSRELSKVETQLFGKYNFENIQTAYALGKYFRISPKAIHEALSEYQPKNNRSQIIEQHGHLIILDAYNANPSSMEAALRSFHTLDTELPKLAILGDMLELGQISDEEHFNLIQLVQTLGIEALYCGELLKKASLQVEGFRGQAFANKEELMQCLTDRSAQPSAIFIKGSRGLALEDVLETL